ncbi:TetR/AcrR family transcriptional regulator [Microlunatus sp. Y2014]|uniref:TetR/AcrR family transcriptional regulator n=1 Tax=Microlunatus sp. Y2014 TaxID=3418488 RepID=UPI003DA6EF56
MAMRGRQAEARRNDDLVLAAALEVFSRTPTAPMSAVAAAAGVGQATLYRRYSTKGELLVAVARRAMTQIVGAAEAALENADPGSGVAEFLAWYATSGTLRTGSLLGTFEPTDDVFTLAHRANQDMQELVARAVAAGRIRGDVTGADLTLIASQVASLAFEDPERTATLRRRYVDLALQALALTEASPLTGPAPDAAEMEEPWERARSRR